MSTIGRIFKSTLRGKALGLASGVLSTSAIATVIAATPQHRLPRAIRSPWVRRFALASAVGEVVANATIESLPRRTERDPLIGRIVTGAAAGALANNHPKSSWLAGAFGGAVAAPFGAWAAANGRAALVKWVPDPILAGFETVVAYGISRASVRK